MAESIHASLRTASAQLSRNDAPLLHVVLGNEAADLDSTVSALAYAFFGPQRSLPAVPVINVTRADFGLRTDIVFLFRQLGVATEDLVFADEVRLSDAHAQQRLRLTLVDHNRLSVAQASLGGSVTALIDHHVDEGMYVDAQPRVVQAVGSCATLVYENIVAPHLHELDQTWARLLLAPIVMDTACLDPAHGKATPADHRVVDVLAPKAFPNDADRKQHLETFYRELFDAKTDVSSLTTEQLLKKDYKQWTAGSVAYGISSVPLLATDFLQRSDAWAEKLTRFCDEQGVQLLLCMGYVDKPSFQRNLIVFSPRAFDDGLAQCLEGSGLGLARLDIVKHDRCVAYSQGNVKSSRKQIQPLVDSYLSRASSS